MAPPQAGHERAVQPVVQALAVAVEFVDPAGQLEPKVMGSACWPCVRPAIGVAWWSSASWPSAFDGGVQLARQQPVRIAHLQRGGRVKNVLRGGAPMDVARCRVAAKLLELVQHRHQRVLGERDLF
jgi:hypothetical protein